MDKNEILKIREVVTPKIKRTAEASEGIRWRHEISKHTMTETAKIDHGHNQMEACICTPKVKLGKGLEKTVKLNLEVFTGERKVRMSDATAGQGVKEWVTKEPGFFSKFKGTKGIAKQQHISL